MIEGGQKLGACLHTCASPEHPHGRVFTPSEYDRQAVRKAQKDARERSRFATDKVGYPEKDTRYVAVKIRDNYINPTQATFQGKSGGHTRFPSTGSAV